MTDIAESTTQNISKTEPILEATKKSSNKIELLNKIFIVLTIVTILGGLAVQSYFQGQAKINSVKNESNGVILNETNNDRVEINSSAAGRFYIPTPTSTKTPKIPTAIPNSTPTPTAKIPTPTSAQGILSFRSPTVGSYEVSAIGLYMNSTLTCTPDSSRKIAAGIWDYGDGANHTFQILDGGYASSPGKTESINTGHGYASPGTYTVTGRCRDDLGNFSSLMSKSITVSAPVVKIDSISPSSGTSGIPIAIRGSNFGTEMGTISMCLSGNCNYPPTIYSWTDTEITAEISGMITQSGSYDIRVTIKSGATSNTVSFTMTAGQPVITSFNPDTKPGEYLTIIGRNFGTTNGQVNFYKNYPTLDGSGTVTLWANDEIHVMVPSNLQGNTEYGVQVITGNGAQSSFEYYTFAAN